jgi:hypothetical protein
MNFDEARQALQRVAFRVPDDCATPGSYLLDAVLRRPELLEEIDPRMIRIAQSLLAYERPRLAVTAITTPADFATRLEAAIARSERAKVIEGEPVERPSLPPAGRQPTNAAAPFASMRRL